MIRAVAVILVLVLMGFLSYIGGSVAGGGWKRDDAGVFFAGVFLVMGAMGVAQFLVRHLLFP